MKFPYILTFAIFFFGMHNTVKGQEDHLRKAEKSFELGHYRKSIDLYGQHLQTNPEDAVVKAKIADAYFQLFELNKSAEWYAKIGLQQMNPDYQLAYAHVLKMQGKYAEAKQWYQSYAKYDPNVGNHFMNSCDMALRYKVQTSIYKVVLDHNNSNSSDFAPAFFKGNLVYASSRGDVGKVVAKNWTGNKTNYLFKAALGSQGEIGKPAYYHGELTDFDNNEGPISYSADGKWVAFCKNKYENGVRQLGQDVELDLYLAEVDQDGSWKNAKAFPHNNGAYSTGWPYLSDDGSTLYFASDMPIVGKGGYDLYKSRKVGDRWTTPENLGSKINTPGNEISPYLLGDELYFSSDWHAGLGGLDIFRVVKDNGAWNEIYNLGNGINSAQDDYNWIYDKNKDFGYLVSNRFGGKGKEDIYRFRKVAQEIEISVLDAVSKRPIMDVEIDFTQCGGGIERTNYKGQFSFHALEGYDCSVSFRKAGYKSLVQSISKGNNNSLKSIEVLMLNAQNVFSGDIVNAANNAAVNKVFVKLTNQASGEIFKAYSNGLGKYTLNLEPNQRYILKYSKAGYTETSRLLVTPNVIPDDILGDYTIIPVGYKEEMPELASASPVAEPPSSSTKPQIVLTKPDKIVHSETEKSYAVQVMSVKASSSKIPNFEKLSPIGEVYVVEIDDLKKYRVGPFLNRADAISASKRILKKGYKNFVVAEKAGLKKEVLHGLQERGIAVEPEKSLEALATEYKIQLGVFKNPDNFDPEPLKPYGVVEKKTREDGLTVILLSGLQNKQNAEAMLGRVNYIGYTTAFLVKEINGEIQPL